MNERDEQKIRWEQYREAVRRLYPQARISPICHVGEPADRDGAFIEIAVWIPVSELQCGALSTQNDLVCTKEPGHKLPHWDESRQLFFVRPGENALGLPEHLEHVRANGE